ncbi:hypothetical protein MKW92_000379, partial [Papaver armeniacum]
MKERNLLDSSDAKFPKFSKAKHQILCSELKQLYVAITRTRQRLWICESIDDFSKPMFDYWKKLCLVQVRELDESLVQAMQVTSSKEEWSSRGIKLLDEGNFEMATMCFERAGDSFLEKLSKASGLRAAGVHMLGSNTELARAALLEAAEIYESIGKADFAAKCAIYLEKCRESWLEDAAGSENFMEAATVARLKGDCLLEADMLEKAGHLVDATEVILFYVLGNSAWANGNKEASILSDTDNRLSEMNDCFIASQRFKSLRGEIISLRKIIDYHLDLAPSEYVWVDDVILNITEHVENSISKNRVSVQTLTYFWNLWKEKIVNILHYLDSLGTQVKQDQSYEKFCLGYLGVLCMQVLEKLESLDKISGIYKVGNEGITALNSYQVAKSVLESKILDKKLSGELLKCLTHSKEHFYAIFCLRDQKHMMFKHMMDLRLTELSQDLIKELTIEIMSKKGRLKYVEMWKLYQVMIQCLDLSPAYKNFIKQLKESKMPGLVSVSLVSNFEKSLQETLNHDWTKDFDFMPPSWFVYFLERLLFLVSSWHGSFFTLKSSVRETVPWGNLRCNSSSLSVADSKVFSKRSFDFIASKIKEILSSKLDWLWERDFDALAYYPFLVLKLVLLVALICLNSGRHFDLLYGLLGRYDIITVLPPQFVKILEKRGTKHFDNLLADILEATGDPLVCLRSGNTQRELLSHNVLEIDVDMIHSREEILEILYSENSECDGNYEMEYGSPSDRNARFSNFDHMSYTLCPAESDYDSEKINWLDTETGEYGRTMQLFTNTSCVYMFSKGIFEDISFHDCKPQMKLDICICFQESLGGPSVKYEKWMRELKQLSFALSC